MCSIWRCLARRGGGGKSVCQTSHFPIPERRHQTRPTWQNHQKSTTEVERSAMYRWPNQAQNQQGFAKRFSSDHRRHFLHEKRVSNRCWGIALTAFREVFAEGGVVGVYAEAATPSSSLIPRAQCDVICEDKNPQRATARASTWNQPHGNLPTLRKRFRRENKSFDFAVQPSNPFAFTLFRIIKENLFVIETVQL